MVFGNRHVTLEVIVSTSCRDLSNFAPCRSKKKETEPNVGHTKYIVVLTLNVSNNEKKKDRRDCDVEGRV